MVERIAETNRQGGEGQPLIGWVGIENGKLFSIQERIGNQLDEAARYITETLHYSLSDVQRMDCYQFHRDILRAQKAQEERIKAYKNGK